MSAREEVLALLGDYEQREKTLERLMRKQSSLPAAEEHIKSYYAKLAVEHGANAATLRVAQQIIAGSRQSLAEGGTA